MRILVNTDGWVRAGRSGFSTLEVVGQCKIDTLEIGFSGRSWPKAASHLVIDSASGIDPKQTSANTPTSLAELSGVKAIEE